MEKADALLIKALLETAELQMNFAFAALDNYNEALQLAQILKDEQLMAQAKAKIGRILFKIMKNKDKARVFLYDVTIIVHKLENTHLRGYQWCKEAVIDLKLI